MTSKYGTALIEVITNAGHKRLIHFEIEFGSLQAQRVLHLVKQDPDIADANLRFFEAGAVQHACSTNEAIELLTNKALSLSLTQEEFEAEFRPAP